MEVVTKYHQAQPTHGGFQQLLVELLVEHLKITKTISVKHYQIQLTFLKLLVIQLQQVLEVVQEIPLQ
jgi:hypothetical protein